MSDVDQLAAVLRDADEIAYDNMHADWARESVARTILGSEWLRDRDAAHRLTGAIRVVTDAQDEREDIAAKLRLEHWITLAPRWEVGRNVPICARCHHNDGVDMRWPCPTLQVLGWPEPPTLVLGDMRHSVDHIRFHATPEAL